MRPSALTWMALGVAIALMARRQLDVVEVRGHSMAPRIGEVVLAPDPREPRRELVKRVAGVRAGGIQLRGDNVTASTDARVAPDRVRWRAALRYWPPNRATTRLGRRRALDPVDEGGEAACAFPEALAAGSGAAS